MTFFVDTSFFVALKNSRDNFHNQALVITANLLHGRLSRLLCSDFILDEAITTVRARTNDHKKAVEVGNMITHSKDVKMIRVGEDIISKAFESYKQHEDKDLSFTDWTSCHIIQQRGLEGIVAFDAHFKQLKINVLE